MQKKYYPYLDLLKFICCIGIVGIHTWPLFYAVEPLKDWYEKLCSIYDLSSEEQKNLKEAIEESANAVKINLLNCNESQKNLAFQFQRSFPDLDEETSKKIIELLKGAE